MNHGEMECDNDLRCRAPCGRESAGLRDSVDCYGHRFAIDLARRCCEKDMVSP